MSKNMGKHNNYSPYYNKRLTRGFGNRARKISNKERIGDRAFRMVAAM
jgi:hypothetical protein